MKKTSILVAALNWGLGHASRCIPVIKALIEMGFEPILASDGAAFLFLKKEFPQLKFEELPSYNISYPENGQEFRKRMIFSLPKIKKAINAEKKQTEELIEKYDLKGIISDNRLGVRSKKIPSVIISHQLQLFTGSTTFFSTKLHQFYLSKFDEIWIPDTENHFLSGKMSQSKFLKNKKFIGGLTRFDSSEKEKKYDVLALLSGPEPQRTLLEKKLLQELQKTDKKVLLVQGIIAEEQRFSFFKNVEVGNFLLTPQLQEIINSSELVLARPGYSTIMDLAKLKKKAFFIPTPGQFEQEYLAKHLEQMKIAPFCAQENFSVEYLNLVENYLGFSDLKNSEKLVEALSFFQSK